jgi:hypothetical protein
MHQLVGHGARRVEPPKGLPMTEPLIPGSMVRRCSIAPAWTQLRPQLVAELIEAHIAGEAADRRGTLDAHEIERGPRNSQ